MSKKLTIEHIKTSFELEGYTLLSKEYKNNKTKLEYICVNKHRHKISWAMWASGNRCPYCTKNNKVTIDTINNSFKSENYILLTTDYINNKQLLNCICPNGNNYSIRWNDWQQDHRCNCDKCSVRYRTTKPKKINFSYVKSMIESEGCYLLSNDYINNRQKLRIKLMNGDEYYTTWLSWQQGKRPWNDSRNLSPTIDELKELFKSEGYTLINDEYINDRTKLNYVCPEGHKHSVVYCSWKDGYRCPKCNKVNYMPLKTIHNDIIRGIVYKATNIANGKVYIGQTIHSLAKRKIKHLSLANKNKIKTHFHRALNKYGKDNFTWEVIEYCDSKEELDDMEFHYIKQYDSYNSGYNMTFGGEGTIGRICKDSTKLKISNSKIGTKASIDTKQLLSDMRRGVKKSESHISNVASSKSSYWEIEFPDGTVEVIKNLSDFCRRNNISDRGMWMVAHGIRTHHKGFKCAKLNNTGVKSNG